MHTATRTRRTPPQLAAGQSAARVTPAIHPSRATSRHLWAPKLRTATIAAVQTRGSVAMAQLVRGVLGAISRRCVGGAAQACALQQHQHQQQLNPAALSLLQNVLSRCGLDCAVALVELLNSSGTGDLRPRRRCSPAAINPVPPACSQARSSGAAGVGAAVSARVQQLRHQHAHQAARQRGHHWARGPRQDHAHGSHHTCAG